MRNKKINILKKIKYDNNYNIFLVKKINKITCIFIIDIVIYIRAIRDMESGQDRKIAALTFSLMCTFYLVVFMDKDNYYMNLAIEEAHKAYFKGEVPVGAIIVYKDEIIATGYNLRETNHNILSHAELIAIKRASEKFNDWRLNETTMYVTLYPCPMCASAIVSSRIKRLVIGTNSNDLKLKQIGELIFDGNNTSPKVEITLGVMEDECRELLSDFFREKRN